jgi:hypothetical protein
MAFLRYPLCVDCEYLYRLEPMPFALPPYILKVYTME